MHDKIGCLFIKFDGQAIFDLVFVFFSHEIWLKSHRNRTNHSISMGFNNNGVEIEFQFSIGRSIRVNYT